jgi:hypothetical protein
MRHGAWMVTLEATSGTYRQGAPTAHRGVDREAHMTGGVWPLRLPQRMTARVANCIFVQRSEWRGQDLNLRPSGYEPVRPRLRP